MVRGRWVPALPLRWRVFGLLAVLAGLLVADVLVGAAYNAELAAERQLSARLLPVEELPERLEAGLVDQQNSVRGFALTGDERLLDVYEARQRAEGLPLLAMRRRLSGEPRLLGLVDEIADGATVWHQRVAEPVIAATRAGQTQRAARLIATADQPLFDAVRADTEALARAVDARLTASQARAESAGDRLDQQLLLTSVLGVLFLLGSGWLMREWLTRPVGELSVRLRRVAAGHLHEQVEGSGPIEFRRLGDDAEVMRRRILDELEESRRAVEALEQNAPLVASLRSLLVGPEAPLPAGLRVAARLEPAEGVLAGDWIETVELEDEQAGLIMVDVSGHGAEAGLRALWLKHLLVPALQMGLDPAETLNWVAGQIGDTGDWFATSIIVELHASTGRCLYANAGHPPALLLGAGGVQELWPTGPLFNVLPGSRWHSDKILLEEGDKLVVYTDGIVEARNSSGEEFGLDRLVECLAATRDLDVDDTADQVMAAVHAFGSERLVDDATLAVATRERVSERVGGVGTTTSGLATGTTGAEGRG
jgi:serine phosphatase RsbU (regulator of sigma subunit)/CHASE3 domain sensor protein